MKCALVTFTFILSCLLHPNLTSGQDSELDAQANNLIQTAVNAQNAGDFQLAAKLWEQLIDEHPNNSLIGRAHHNLGICYVQTGDLPKAAEALKTSLSTLPKSDTEKLARSYLFLGFAQGRIGKDFGAKGDQEKSQEWLTTATNTLEQLRSRFPDFVELDQACFFQGEAYESLERLDKAAESYARMLEFPNPAFKFDGLMALANVQEQLGKFDEAINYYDRLRDEANNQGGHPLLTEAEFRKAETVLKQANAAEERGVDATAFYEKAESLFAEVAKKPDFELADTALYRQAFCANRQRQFEKSAGLYLQVAELPNSKLAPRSLVFAGRDFMSAGKNDEAAKALGKAVEVESEFTPEAVHWLIQLQLRNQQNSDALALADKWVARSTPDNPQHVNLLLDRADAAYLVEDRRRESPGLFLEIADNFPDHELAPTALYNAAFACLELSRFEDAIKLADRFQEKYKNSEYLPDALEVKADASLLNSGYQTAESVFRRLVQDYPDSTKAANWNLRIGLALYLQQKYREAIDWLEVASSHMSDKTQLAEAFHIIGASQFDLKQDTDAISSLSQSISNDPRWRRADETLMTLSLAQLRAGQSDEALATNVRLLREYPKSPLIGRTVFNLGEMAYAKRDFKSAVQHYLEVVQKHPESTYVPHALYGAGWSSVELEDFEQSLTFFTKLMTEFPDHERAKSGKVGRGVSYRKSGNPEAAVGDFTDFLNTGVSGKDELDALYELGLAQVDLKKWNEVVATFNQLLNKSPESQLADRIHYELAWAHQSQGNKSEALKHFGIIANEHGSSPLAPEANFHLANESYEAEKYADAAQAYTKCLNSKASDSLREKSAYKLAWCHYKQKNYEQSLKEFQQQVEMFPEGELKADGLLMVSDSLYRLERHQEAFAAYRVAKPAIEATKPVEARVRWQALLHGGQSANKSGQFDEAIEFVQPIIDSNVTSDDLKCDAYLEIGNAHKGNGNFEEARNAWSKAAVSISETGAEARCLMGELLFTQGKHEDAINEYKLVYYGYGGKQASPEIQKWQAFAVFEAAQCHYAQIKQNTEPALRTKLVAEAKKLYQYLIDNYPNDLLVNESKKRIQSLQQLN